MKHDDWRDFADGFITGLLWTVVLLGLLGLVWLFVSDMAKVLS